MPWPADVFGITDEAARSGGTIDVGRRPSRGLSNVNVSGSLRRLFTDPTVRGCIEGPTSSLSITVLRDEKFSRTGKEGGVRYHKKWWNGFRQQSTMQYSLDVTGSYGFALMNSPESQHIYLADIYSYGLEGLDSSLPDPKTPLGGVLSGPSGAASWDRKTSKRAKSDESVLSAGSSDSFPMEDVKSALPVQMEGDSELGVADITTVMKLYFKGA